MKNPTQITHICPLCGGSHDGWKEVYFRENAQLVRQKNLFMVWCENSGLYAVYEMVRETDEKLHVQE